ncbi:MAG: glycine cleavage system protein GcvH [Clostridia bacterium]|nr:glycine cleavage system protein GcvH [Clostridia bacterium]
MNIPQDLLFTKTHEWVKKTEDGTVLVGLTDYAQSELGDLVFVNLPMEGDSVEAEESFADVESVKAVSDVNSPVTGTVVAVNDEVVNTPALINETPYDAWLVEVGEIEDTEELMNADEYAAFLETL